jgi:hypothetical protein
MALSKISLVGRSEHFGRAVGLLVGWSYKFEGGITIPPATTGKQAEPSIPGQEKHIWAYLPRPSLVSSSVALRVYALAWKPSPLRVYW